MAKIESFVKGRYIFVPDTVKGARAQPHAVTLTPDQRLTLDFNGETRRQAEERFAAFSAVFGSFEHGTTVECPKGGGVVLKKTFENAGEQLKRLHELDYLTDNDFAKAHLRCVQTAPAPSRATPKAPLRPALKEAAIHVTRSVL